VLASDVCGKSSRKRRIAGKGREYTHRLVHHHRTPLELHLFEHSLGGGHCEAIFLVRCCQLGEKEEGEREGEGATVKGEAGK
jgi:hypothetical protein